MTRGALVVTLKDSLKQLKNALKQAKQEDGRPGAREGSVFSVHSHHPKESLESTKRLLDKDPKNRELLDWYAFMLFSNERFEEAVSCYEKLLAQEPRVIEHRYYLGCCFYHIGRVEDAVTQWQEAINIDALGAYGQKAREKLDHVYDRDYGSHVEE